MKSWFGHTLRGACMGVADIIPGVSGGTMALILGIYDRFVGAISAIGPALVRAALGPDLWRRVAAGMKEPGAQGEDEVGTLAGHVLFLGFLGVGIAAAFLVGARFVPTLLSIYPAQMKGFFFGLVLSSVVVPYRLMTRRGASQAIAFAVALVGIFTLVGLPHSQSGNAAGEVRVRLKAPANAAMSFPAHNVLFSTQKDKDKGEHGGIVFGPSAAVRIGAGEQEVSVPVVARMSGAMANLEPHRLTSARGLPEGSTVQQAAPMSGGLDPSLGFVFLAGCIAISAMVLPGISGSFILLMLGLYHTMTFALRALIYAGDTSQAVTIGVFLSALLVGIMSFSRVLRWLLEHHHDTTMAALVGMMLGSLRKIWPFIEHDGATVVNVLPSSMDTTTLVTLALFAIGVGAVWLLERTGRRASSSAS